MATVITHFIVAGSLSSMAPKTIPRLRVTFVLGILAMVPDLDVIGFQLGVSYSDPLGHRGFTHSILFAMLVELIVSSVVFRPGRHTDQGLVGIGQPCVSGHHIAPRA